MSFKDLYVCTKQMNLCYCIFMKFNFVLLKQISILSTLIGILAGILTLIPYLGTISFIFLLCFTAPVVIWLLVKYGCISLSNIQESIIIGVISGFVAYLAFSLIFIPVSVILINMFHFAVNYGVGIMLINASFFLLLITSIFMGIVGATINAFTGFITFYLIELINSLRK